MSSRSRSRSRSRTGSRSPSHKRSHRRNIRDESISPIRTASGANLRTPKLYNNNNLLGYNRNNYQHNNYQRNNYNNRGFQRYNNYNNYGNRWNRGRGNYYNRGGWQNRNQWNNYQPRHRYHSRSDRSHSRSRSRGRSRSRSYSRSRSGSRSRSRSYDKRRRRTRSRSYSGSDRSRSKSRSNSRSPSPRKRDSSPTNDESKGKSEKERTKAEDSRKRSPNTSQSHDDSYEAAVKKLEVKSSADNVEQPVVGKSRWETPEHSPGGKDKDESGNMDMDLTEDKIFDQWDDDKLRAYLLKSKAKKLAKDGKNLAEGTQANPPQPSQAPIKTKKKKRTKSTADSPVKETRGRKKKRSLKKSRSSSTSSSSSSSWSPIHKAHKDDNSANIKEVKQDNNEKSASLTNQQIYSQQQNYSMSTERTQAVQYPFSHIGKQPTKEQPVQAPSQQYPAPVPPPQAQAPQATQVLGEMQIIGPDGTPVRLVPTSVMGPDGKMMQVMQIQPSANVSQAPATTPAPVAKAQRIPPPPPSYPPSTSAYPVSQPHANSSQYTKNATESYNQLMESINKGNVAEQNKAPGIDDKLENSLKAHLKNVISEEVEYDAGDHTTSLKKMERQKRRQEVVRTRFKPRPAGTWAQDVKKDEEKPKEVPSLELKEKPQAIPTLGSMTTTSSNVKKEEYSIPTLTTENKIETITSSTRKIPVVQPPEQLPPGINEVQPVGQQASNIDSQTQHYAQVPPQLAAQGYKAVLGNPQVLVGPNGEMLQLISSMPASANQPTPVTQVNQTSTASLQNDNWRRSSENMEGQTEKSTGVPKKDDSSSSDDEDVALPSPRMRLISGGSDKKSKKKSKTSRSMSVENNDSDGDDEITVKRKKEMKKKKKKNKKKKEEMDDDESQNTKQKKKKKEKKQKEKGDVISLEHMTLTSKKDLKGFREVDKKKSKKDDLNRNIAEELPWTHIRSIVPRRKGEASQPLLMHVNLEARTKASIATSTSYEERFVSLFGSGEVEQPSVADEEEPRIDITKKSVRKFKVNVKGPRTVGHMTKICLSDRLKKMTGKDENEKSGEEDVDYNRKEKSPQKANLDISNSSKKSRKSKSPSRSASRSSSASSDSADRLKTKRKRRKSRSQSRSRSRSSRSRSRSRSRSKSLPAAYSSDRKVIAPRYRSNSRDRSGGSRSRSRSYSPNDDRDRYRGRQTYQYRNNQGYYYNNQGYRYNNNRGYYQNRGRGRFNNYYHRGYFRGRYNNWNNNQGYYNRNQNYRQQRYRDDRHRDRSRSYSPDRSRDRSDRSSSRERSRKSPERTPTREKPEKEHTPVLDEQQSANAQADKNENLNKPMRKKSPEQWTHDMFEQEEAAKDENKE